MRKSTILFIFALLCCSENFASLTQSSWRWHNNDGDEQAATWAAPQSTGIMITDDKAYRLRVIINNTSDQAVSAGSGLSYSTSTDKDTRIPITEASPINAFILAGDNALITHKTPTTRQLLSEEEVFAPGYVVTKVDTEKVSIPPGASTEFEWFIKPTSHIKPNTTYVFYTDAANSSESEILLYTDVNYPSSSISNYITNSGFEQEMDQWQVIKENGSTATSSIASGLLEMRTGDNSFKIEVIDPGPTNSISLNQTINDLDTGTYLLRFWAIAKDRNAQLDIELNNGLTSDYCHYQIYDRFDESLNGWQQYQYAFRVMEDAPLELKFHFNSASTYFLDDIEIINQATHPNLDIASQYMWQNNFKETYGWLSGDNNNPVLLPDSSIAWIFNDAFMGTTNPHTNVLTENHIVNNMIVHQVGDSLKSIYGGFQGNAQNLFSPGNGNLFWQSGGIIEDGSLKVLLIEINNGNYAGSSWVGSLSLPDFQFESLRKLPITIDVNPNCIMTDDDYNYIYFGQSDAALEMHTIVARVPVDQFDSNTPWEFYQEDGSWSTDFSAPKHILENASAGNVIKLSEGNYVMSAVPHLSNEIAVWFAPTPYGPWVNKTVIYRIAPQEGILAYQGHLSPLAKDGYYTLTYSIYPFVTEENGSSGSVAMQMAVKSTYLPIYTKGELMEYSPFTPVNPEQTLLQFSGAYQNNIVTLNWVSPNTTDHHYEIQHSVDGNIWTNKGIVSGADSVTSAAYTSMDLSPSDGLNFYRIALYDEDQKIKYSSIININTDESLAIHLTDFSAFAIDNASVNLQWTTAFEQDKSNFTIERSTDGVRFKTIAQVPSAGSNSSSYNYHFTDTQPVAGINYYRLSFISDGQIKKSEIQSVNVKQAASILLQIAPNPTSKNVQFKLQGYNKTSFYGKIIDLAGRQVDAAHFNLSTTGKYQFNKKLSSGLYILQIFGDQLQKNAKVLIK